MTTGHPKRIIWLPLVLLGGVLLFDKVCLLPSVRNVFQPIGAMQAELYESRELLFEAFRKEVRATPRTVARPRVGLVLGTSRSMSLSTTLFEARGERPVYNFSTPASAPSYYAYWLERVAAMVPPDFVIVEFDTSLLSHEAGRLALAHGYDAPFVWRHFYNTPAGRGFGRAHVESFVLNHAFAMTRFPPDPLAAWRNYKERTAFVPGIGEVRFRRIDAWPLSRERVRLSVERHRGGFPDNLSFQDHVLDLEGHATRTARRFGRFRPDPLQQYFLQVLVDQLAQTGVPTLFYWPMATPALHRRLDAVGYNRPYQERLGQMLAAAGQANPQARFAVVDYNATMRCRNFSDSFHLAGACIPELVDHLLLDLRRLRQGAAQTPR